MSPATLAALVVGAAANTSLTATETSTPAPDNRWKLVLDETFDEPGPKLADWSTFGDAGPMKVGDAGDALRLTAAGGIKPPAYAGAFQALGGGIKADEIVRATVRWKPSGPMPADARFALKLECKDRGGAETGVIETLLTLDGSGWRKDIVEGQVPGGTASVSLAMVVVPSTTDELATVLVDAVEADRRAAPVDLLASQGGWEANDGGAEGWSAFNNAIAIDDPRHERVLKTWGPYNEPYGGSGVTMMVPLDPGRRIRRLEASVEALTARSDSIAKTDNFPILRIECLDADGRPLAHTEGRPFDPGAGEVPVDRWTPAKIGLDVPEATTQVKYVLAFIQPTTMKGAVLFRKPRLGVPKSSRNLLPNPAFAGGSGLPGWSVNGKVARDDRNPRTGAAALRLPAAATPASLTSGTFAVQPGEQLRLDGHYFVPAAETPESNRAFVEIDVVQRQRRGKELDRRTIRAVAGAPDEWLPLATESDSTFETVRGAATVELEIRGPGGNRGAVLVDDLALRRVKDDSAPAIAIPVRNPGFEGGRPDPKHWDVSDGAWSHNGELQYYAPDRAVIRDGAMRITADQRSVGDRKMSSAHVSTAGRHELKHGRWEIRAKLPTSQGMWPAMWLLPSSGAWPPEIDIIELVGKEPNQVHHSFHYGPLRDGLLPWDLGQTSTDHHEARDYENTWHDFAVEWTPEGIVWFVDGQETHRFGTTAEERSKLPTEPMYFIMNVAVGGFWPGPPGAGTRWPGVMDVDRVRIWSYEGK